MTPKMIYSFYRIGGALKVRLRSPAMSAAEDRRIKMYSSAVLSTEEAMLAGTYDVSAPPVVMTRAEFEKVRRFLPDPIPANVEIVHGPT